VTRPGAALALALAASGCTAATGTVSVELATAPGSHVLDPVHQLRLTLTRPHRVIEATRGAAGFELALDLDASAASGAVIVEGFDAVGALVACGQSPGFPLAAVNAHIVIYMAPPRSFGAAPVALAAPRSDIAGGPLVYGAVLAGGRDAGGAASAEIAIYNAYDHSLARGAAMPAPRAGVAVGTSASGAVYLFGGTGPDGAATATLWRFDTTVANGGSYTIVSDQAGLARTGQLLIPIGAERYLVTGAPPLTLQTGALTPQSGIAALPAVGAAGGADGGMATAVFAGAQLVWFHRDGFQTLDNPGRSDASATALPDGRVVVIGGGDPVPSRDAVIIDGATGAVTVVPDALATPRIRPSLAATSRHLVVAGGTDPAGAVIATAELLDAHSLAAIATLPIAPRTGAFAVALPNDQVLLAGGTPASAEIELFTPEPPP
jgi:hypothetical protein